MQSHTSNKKAVDTFDGRVYTNKYTIYGLLYTPPNEDMDVYLNKVDRAFVPISEPMIYRSTLQYPPDIRTLSAAPPFIAVHKDKILWLVGARASDDIKRHVVEQRVAILFDDFFLAGNIQYRENTRMSSYLEDITDKNAFQALTNVHLCRLKHKGYEVFSDDAPLERFDTVVVNLYNAEGVIEFEGGPKPSKAPEPQQPKTLTKGAKVRVKLQDEHGMTSIEIGRIQREIRADVYLLSFEDRMGERNDLVIIEKSAILEILP